MKKLLLLLVACMVSMLAFAQTESSTNSTGQDDETGISEAASGVTLTPSSLNFGDVQITRRKSLPVLLTNNQSVKLNISDITTTTWYSETDNCGRSLGPHASCTITVTFSPILLKTINGTMSVIDNGPGSPQKIGLSGTGVQGNGCYTLSGGDTVCP